MIRNALGGNGLKTRAVRNLVHFNVFYNNQAHDLELIGPDPGSFGHWYFAEANRTGGPGVAAHQKWLMDPTLNAGPNPSFGNHFQREDHEVVGNLVIETRGAHSRFGFLRAGGDGTGSAPADLSDHAGQAFGESWGRYRIVNNTFVVFGTNANTRAIRLEFGVESVELWNNVFYSEGTIEMVTMGSGVNAVRWLNGRQLAGANNHVYGSNILAVPGVLRNTVQRSGDPFVDRHGWDFRLREPVIGVPFVETVETWPEYDYVIIPRSEWGPAELQDPDNGVVVMLDARVEMKDTSFPNPLLTLEWQPNRVGDWFDFMDRRPRTDGTWPVIGAFSSN
jgi:hypothetical protein